METTTSSSTLTILGNSDPVGYIAGSGTISWQRDTIYPADGNNGQGPVTKLHIYQGEGVNEMRGLFHIVIVDYKNDDILKDALYIAKDAETAKIKALAPYANDHDLDDLDVICIRLGEIRKEKEIQEVRILKDN